VIFLKEKILVPNVLQVEALKKIEEAQKKRSRGVVVMPTGIGKTFLACLWFKRQLEKNPKSSLLFICHNGDILSQANEREFQKRLNDFDIKFGYYRSGNKNKRQVTFATTQTLTRNLDKFKVDEFDFVIVDEAHHYQARTFKKVVKYFKPKFLLGLTATPFRMDKKNIFSVCGKPIYNAKVSDAIKMDLLSKINYYCVDNDIDFSKIKWKGNGYDEKDLNRKICVKEYDDAIISEYRKSIKEHKRKNTICFCVTIEHCFRMERLFNENGIKSVALTSKKVDRYGTNVGKNYRKNVISGFRNGDYDIIFVVDLFNEGVDLPRADSIMMIRPTRSHTIFTQQIGRGLRKANGKDYLLVLDFTGNARKCTINFEVLGEMLDLNIIEGVKKKSKKYRGRREVIFVSNGSVVRLNRVKFNILDSACVRYSKSLLKHLYIELREELGRIPSAHDLLKYGLPGPDVFASRFGSWLEFKKVMGDNTVSITKSQIKEQFLEFYKKHGRAPKVRDTRKYNMYSDNTVRDRFGSWGKALEYCGLSVYRYTKLDLNKEWAVSDYKKLKKKLGRVPLQEEIEKYTSYSFESFVRDGLGLSGYKGFMRKVIGSEDYNNYKVNNRVIPFGKEEAVKRYLEVKKSGKKCDDKLLYAIRKYFGGVRQLQEELGKDFSVHNKVPKQELINRFEEVRGSIGRTPTIDDMKNHGYSYGPYKRVWDGWVDFLKSRGLKPNHSNRKRKKPRDFNEYVKEYYRIKNKLGKVPTFEELKKESNLSIGHKRNSVFYDYGNGYISFLKKIGEKPNIKYYTKDDIINLYYKKKKELGRIPFCKELGISSCVINRKYGSYGNFLYELGEVDNKNTRKLLKIRNKDIIKDFKSVVKKLGKVPTATEYNSFGKHRNTLINKRFGAYEDFLRQLGYDPKSAYHRDEHKNHFLTNEEMFKEYGRVKKILGRTPVCTDFCYKGKIPVFSEKLIRNRFAGFVDFRNRAERWLNRETRKNIIIISKYKPKNSRKKSRKSVGKTKSKGKSKKDYKWGNYNFKSDSEKVKIRKKIVKNISNGDNVLLLESPELSTIREIERQGIKPKKIFIPNHMDFKKMCHALKSFDTDLEIELINTSVLQYMIDTDVKFDFIWLDYCGGFSYYIEDLNTLFAKNFGSFKLVLTYNIFDPKKSDGNYYFTRVIDYVLEKLSGKNKMRLINDISYRYKKTMYNIGFKIG